MRNRKRNSQPPEEGKTPLDTLLKKLSMSVPDLARELEIDKSTVYRWKAGQSEPNFTLRQMKAFQILLWRHGMDIRDLPDQFHAIEAEQEG